MKKLGLGGFLLSLTLLQANCCLKYTDHIVQYADEHDPHNHIITINYKNMELLEKKEIDGSLNHHADPLGTLSSATYMLLVPKGSYFVHAYDIRNDNFVKKIRLPFRPRSSDAYNKKYNLTLLNGRDRPVAVLIDDSKLKIVGKAGFNIRCSQEKAQALPIFMQYAKKEIYDKNYKCKPIDFGGDQISGHPIWFNDHLFGIIDRANRAIHVYKIKKRGDIFKTKLVQTISTVTSIHQIIPKGDGSNIFYGSCEGNGAKNLISGVYKFKVKHDRVYVVKYTPLQYNNIFGTNGHNIYITPDKKYLFVPAASTLQLQNDSDENFFADFKRRVQKLRLIKQNYRKFIKMYADIDDDIDIFDYKKIKKIFKKNKKFSEFLPTYVPSFSEYLLRNYYQQYQYKFIPKGGVFIVDAKTMKIKKFIYTGIGAGHVAFSKQKGLAIVTNHLDRVISIINYKEMEFVTNIYLDFPRANFTKLTQSHMQYVSSDGKYYYNFWSDGGYFFRINLDELDVDSVIEVGGVPIQGNFYEKVNTTCDLDEVSSDDGYDRFFNDIDENGDDRGDFEKWLRNYDEESFFQELENKFTRGHKHHKYHRHHHHRRHKHKQD